jgi:hypothetical protein
MKKELDKGLLGKLTQSIKTVDTVQSPVQKVIPVTDSQRSGETQCNFWIDRRLKRALQVQAVKQGVDLKKLFVDMAERYCDENDIDWRNSQ